MRPLYAVLVLASLWFSIPLVIMILNGTPLWFMILIGLVILIMTFVIGSQVERERKDREQEEEDEREQDRKEELEERIRALEQKLEEE